MNPWVGWLLVAVGLLAGWRAYGWQGLVVVATFAVFWLLLQFNRSVRAMRNAAQSPMGQVDSAVMLHAKLREGMPLLEIVTLTRSLGRKTSDDPETLEWRDASGAVVEVVLERGHCRRWSLLREEPADDAS